MNERDDPPIELVDFGDAMIETKQCSPYMPIYPDSYFGWGEQPWPTQPDQCPR